MKKHILILSIFLCAVFIAPQLSHALRIVQDTPVPVPVEDSMSIEQAIRTARTYVTVNDIDVSQSYLAKVEYIGLRDGERKPYWLVEWRRKETAKGGWFDVLVYFDDTVSIRLGE